MSNLYINRFLPSKFVPVINVHLGKYKICVLPLDNGVKIHILLLVDYHRGIFIILKINLFRDYFKQNFIKKTFSICIWNNDNWFTTYHICPYISQILFPQELSWGFYKGGDYMWLNCIQSIQHFFVWSFTSILLNCLTN